MKHIDERKNQAVTSDPPRPRDALRVAYLMSRFPKITETFVLREMVEMERLGVTVDVFPLQSERTTMVHPEAVPFVRRARFAPLISGPIFAANIRSLVAVPRCYLSALGAILRANLGSLRYLAGAIAFFPKAVWFAAEMRRLDVQHVHAHFASHPAAVAWVIHRLCGIPFSFTAHGSDLHRDRHMLREKVAEAAAVVTISEYNRRLILDHCGPAAAARVHVIHCGVDPDVFERRTKPTPFEHGRASFQIACVGTLHEVKGQKHLLAAVARLRERGVCCTCHLLGDGPDRRRLERMAKSLSIADSVRFHGRRTSGEVRELLRDVDLLVAPSVPTKCGRREGIPVALMEALSCGVPVVASDLSGIPELVIHDRTGLLVKPGDVSGLADAIETMYLDPSLRHRVAEAGRELVAREFHSATNAALLKGVIESALDPAGPTRSGRIPAATPAASVDPQPEEACLC